MSPYTRLHRLLTPLARLRRVIQPEQQALPWVIEVVSSLEELDEALRLRGAAYGRHLGHADYEPDPPDFDADALVLVARHTSTREILGTMRVGFSSGGRAEMLRWHPDPKQLAQFKIGEARRLALKPSGHATLVKLSLWKAFWKAGVARGADLMIVAARPPMNADYRMLLFEEPVEGGVYFKPPDVPDEHELLILKLAGLEERYRKHSPELYRFMVELDLVKLPGAVALSSNPLRGLDRQYLERWPEGAVRA